MVADDLQTLPCKQDEIHFRIYACGILLVTGLAFVGYFHNVFNNTCMHDDLLLIIIIN